MFYYSISQKDYSKIIQTTCLKDTTMANLPLILHLFHSTGLTEKAYTSFISMSVGHFSNCLHGKRNFQLRHLKKMAQKHSVSLETLQNAPALQNEINDIKRFWISDETIALIKSITASIENLHLMQDKEIRDTYARLMYLIAFKEEGLISCN